MPEKRKLLTEDMPETQSELDNRGLVEDGTTFRAVRDEPIDEDEDAEPNPAGTRKTLLG